MCSKASALPQSADLAGRLGSVIDDLATMADGARVADDGELAARLAAAWALIAEVDPELADRTARYSR
jgi:hypothetical protein